MTFSDAFPGKATFNICGEEVMLDAPKMPDWGTICQAMREQIPNRLPEVTKVIGESGMPESMALTLFREAQKEARERDAIQIGDAMQAVFDRPAWFAHMLYVLAERNYPGRFILSQVLASVVDQFRSQPAEFYASMERLARLSGFFSMAVEIAAEVTRRREASPQAGIESTADSSSHQKPADSESIPTPYNT